MDPLIGRRLELDVLLDHVKRAIAGESGTVLVAGEAGVGKSRLVHEALEQARLLGCRTLYGSAGEFERGVPYAVVRDALAPAIDAETDPRLARPLEVVRSALGLHVGPEGAPDEGSPGEVRRAAFAAGEQLLRAWADRDPLLLALDDLHAADEDTLGLLSLLTRHLRGTRVLIVGALRAHPPDLGPDLEALIDRLVRDELITRIELGPLDPHDVRALAAVRVDAMVDEGTADTLWDWSRGNPFFVEEAINALETSGALSVGNGRCTLRVDADAPPVSARNSVLFRVFKLGSDARAVASAVSVFQRFPLDRVDLLSELTGVEEVGVARQFDELVRANVLRRTGSGDYEFTHPIVRTALYGDLGPAERRRLHGLVAGRLRADREAGRPVSTHELAAHVFHSAAPGDVSAAEILAEAGDASRFVAPISAARWYGRALELIPPKAPERATYLARRAHALYLAGRLGEAVEVGREAVSALERGSRRARAAALVVTALTVLGRVEEALEAAGEILASSDDPMSRLRAAYGTILVYLDRFDEAEGEGHTAIRSAGEDPATASFAWGQLAASAYAQGHIDVAIERLDRQLACAERVSPSAHLSALATRAVYLAQSGLVADARSSLERADELSEQLGGGAFRSSLDHAHVFVDFLSGRWDEALERAAWADIELSRSGQLLTLDLIRTVAGSILTERGEFGRAREVFGSMVARPVGASFAGWATAGLDLALGELEEAKETLTRWWEHDRSVGRLSTAPFLLERIAAVELARGDRDAARGAAREAAKVGGSPWARLQALLARAAAYGELATARKALSLADELDIPFEQARAKLLVGSLGKRFDHLLTEAHEIFRSLGAEPHRRRAAAELRSRSLPVPRRRRNGGDGLTDTESELARLVNEGLSNRQIAEVLYLSPKTIEVYLSRLYQKVGCSGRIELAVAVSEGRIDV